MATIPAVVKPVPAPTSTTDKPGASRASSSATDRIAGVQNSGLTQRSYHSDRNR